MLTVQMWDGYAAPEVHSGKIWFDIETRKVEAPAGWPNKRRWQAFMIGTAKVSGGVLTLEVAEGTEGDVIEDFEKMLRYHGPMAVYGARVRDFDKWVMCGRFTNARRGLNPVPGSWPHVDEKAWQWKNIWKAVNGESGKNGEKSGDRYPGRLADLPSIDVPEVWATGNMDMRAVVVLHCLRDVAELVLLDPDVVLPAETRKELDQILTDPLWAEDFLNGYEDEHED